MNEGTYCTFMGQAGFLFVTQQGIRIGVDLYLSNCCQRLYGFKRLLPYIVKPQDLELDYVIATHHHEDHFDVDALPILLEHKKTELIAALDCQEKVKEFKDNIEKVTYIKSGDVVERDSFRLIATFCDHGESAPHAIGLLLEMDGKRVYITGDTALRLDKCSDILAYGQIDLMICPINGMFGNMNESQAAEYASVIHPTVLVPCHYWNFAEHQGNPYLFQEIMKNNYPHQQYCLMRVGENLLI